MRWKVYKGATPGTWIACGRSGDLAYVVPFGSWRAAFSYAFAEAELVRRSR